MKYKPTVLNIFVGIFLTGILIYTVLNYKTLSAEEDWGIIAMVGLAGIGIIAGLVDFLCQRLFRNTKLLNIAGISIIVVTLGIITLFNLPFQWTRKSDIKFGNKLIDKIETYRIEQGRLPGNDDWETLKKLGFKVELLGTKPAYTKIDSANYELVYLEGFDGPYLLWNTKTKQWKIDFAASPEKEKIEMESDFPWSKKITKIAVQAILTSIENINSTDSTYDKNFPADINNMSFIQKDKTDFIIVGYSRSENFPTIYKIDFQPKNSHKLGARITVEIDIEKERAIRVYTTPDV